MVREISQFAPLAVCNAKTVNVGNSVTIQIVVRNNGTVNLPIGTYILMTIPDAPGGAVWVDAETGQEMLPGGTMTVTVVGGPLDSVPPSWVGASLKVNVWVYESKAHYDNDLGHIVADVCEGLINVSSAELSAEVVSITAI